MIKKKLLFTLPLIFALAVSLSVDAKSPKKHKKKPSTEQKATVTADLTNQTSIKKKKPKVYNQVITRNAKTSNSFFDVHFVNGKYFFEIPDSIIGRDILVVNRIAKAPVNRYKSNVGYPGDQIGENVIRFEKAPNNKILIRSVSYLEQSKDSLGMYQSVKNSNIQPIVASLDVEAYRSRPLKNIRTSVIDITSIIESDNDIFFFQNNFKKFNGINTFKKELSYVDTIKAFPLNVEIKTVKTYNQSPPKGFPAAKIDNFPSGLITYELNSSMVLLPKEPMKPRFFDPRVGYFATRYTDYDANPQGVEYKSMIARWRLEPKDEDVEKYEKGELVEPKKPIVFYIDPATPKKWIPYLIAGVNDWQKAFEQAGFKNAVYALEAPSNDPTWSLEDARHSAIIYKPSNISNARGPNVHDPRSGEIMETHIYWYHNVMKLLHDWYMIQAGTIDPGARSMVFDDELMGQLIRFVSSHEVGHTLGLRHNFASSNTIPVEKLRDKAWVEANGHTPSIMDYARFNYVAQPEDNISREGIFPRIGMYDKWAIEWGYKYLPQYQTAEQESSYLNLWIIKKLSEDKRYTFGTESDYNDPRNQNEDLGDNAMLASSYGIKNLKRIVPNIMQWSRQPNKGYENAAEIYRQLISQYRRYMGHVAKNVGGIYSTPRSVEEVGVSSEFVPAAVQKEAVLFLDDQLFTTPAWLIDKELIQYASVDPISEISTTQRSVLNRLISKQNIDKMQRNEAYNGNKAYSATNMFRDLKQNIWKELHNGQQIDIYRRNLQKNYINALITIVTTKPSQAVTSQSSDATSIARAELYDLQRLVKSTIASSTGLKRAHLQDILANIETALDTKK